MSAAATDRSDDATQPVRSRGFRAPERPSAVDECVSSFVRAAREGARASLKTTATATCLRLEAMNVAHASRRRQSEQNLRAIEPNETP